MSEGNTFSTTETFNRYYYSQWRILDDFSMRGGVLKFVETLKTRC